jgi:hypothetical protein
MIKHPFSPLVLRFQYIYGKALPSQSFPIILNNHMTLVHLNEQGVSQPLTFQADNQANKTQTVECIIDHFEMINLKTGYPTHKQIITIDENTHEFCILVLPPPIVIDFRSENKMENLLSEQQVQYFKDNGANALVFVHGYDLPLGQSGYYPEAYEIKPNVGITEYQLKDPIEKFKPENSKTLSFKKSAYRRSIACCFNPPHEILAHFPDLYLYYQTPTAKFNHKPENNPEGLGEKEAFFNGTDAHHWFTHMEHNFNRAAGFYGKNYQDYTRILNIHWPSGDGPTEFGLAEKMAELSAERFLYLIQQLLHEKIKINIIAHSLGCRLVLATLQLLVEKERNKTQEFQTIQKEKQVKEMIDHIIFWQAAVPNTVFNPDSPFKEIHHCTQKITVLYSKKDTILQTLYSTAHLSQLTLHQALGYTGPVVNDHIQNLKKSGKLLCIDQSNLLFGHSFMKRPTKLLMREIYQEYIIGGQYGIRAFGNYPLGNLS